MSTPTDPATAPTILEAIARHDPESAVVVDGEVLAYPAVRAAAHAVATDLLDGRTSLDQARVVIATRADAGYVASLLGVWAAGGIAVPIRPGIPQPEVDYVVEDTRATLVLHDATTVGMVSHLAGRDGVRLHEVAVRADGPADPPVPPPSRDTGALMIYTSGTTGRPKGVVHTHGSLAAQVASLQSAWGWSADDRIPLVLPLHHVHGIVNVLCCALATGATCEMQGGLDPVRVWDTLGDDDTTLFMAVPTIYGRLIRAWEEADEATRQRWSDGARSLRLMVSGSAALPVDMLERWEQLTGHRLLERYGMSEVGMALSNTLEERVPGTVGYPLPGVRARLVDDEGRGLDGDDVSGHLQLQGPAQFREYWGRPEATRESFVDGWFDTGDDAGRTDGRYRILGRASVDILKSGGEKVSALEVEFVYRTHDRIDDIAVVGVPDPTWGQRICAAVVAASDDLDTDGLRAWGKQRLADYKVPREFLIVDDLPRNAMGKVTKPAVTELFDA